MTKPTANSTAAAEAWLQSQQGLQSMLDEALADKEIAQALARENIPATEAIAEDPTLLARIGITRRWSTVLARSPIECGAADGGGRVRALP